LPHSSTSVAFNYLAKFIRARRSFNGAPNYKSRGENENVNLIKCRFGNNGRQAHPRRTGVSDLAKGLRLLHADQVDFDQGVLHQQSAGLEGCARRRHIEILTPHLVVGGEISQIGQEEPRSKASTLGTVSAHRRTTSNAYVFGLSPLRLPSGYCGFRPAASTALR